MKQFEWIFYNLKSSKTMKKNRKETEIKVELSIAISIMSNISPKPG
jgi:hypothetical protein